MYDKREKSETNIQIIEVINNGKCFWVELFLLCLLPVQMTGFFFFSKKKVFILHGNRTIFSASQGR